MIHIEYGVQAKEWGDTELESVVSSALVMM